MKYQIAAGLYLNIEQNTEPAFSFELWLDLENEDGLLVQQLAIVRPPYRFQAEQLSEEQMTVYKVWDDAPTYAKTFINPEEFEVLLPSKDTDEMVEYLFSDDPLRANGKMKTTPLKIDAETLLHPEDYICKLSDVIRLSNDVSLQAACRGNEFLVGVVKAFRGWHQNLARVRVIVMNADRVLVIVEPFEESMRSFAVAERWYELTRSEEGEWEVVTCG